MKYVIGFENKDKFVVLYESSNIRLALLIAKRYQEKFQREMKIKKG